MLLIDWTVAFVCFPIRRAIVLSGELSLLGRRIIVVSESIDRFPFSKDGNQRVPESKSESTDPPEE